MRKKLMVLDIDGTLTNSKKEITPATKKALFGLMDKGHIVAIASGRPTAGVTYIADELELNKRGGFVLSYNGARITDWKTGSVLYQKKLDTSLLPTLYHYAKKKDIGLVTYEDKNVVTGTRHDEYMELEARINRVSIKDVSDFINYVNFDVNKCLLSAAGDVAADYEKELQMMLEEKASVYRSEPFFIEVMPKGVDKAASLKKLLEVLNMNRKDMVCCGDGFNDISMIKYAGVGVAMSNASDTVKEAADYITLSNDEDGLIPVIEKYFE